MSDGDDNDGRELGDDNGELNTKKRQRRHKSDEQHDIILAQPDGTYKLIHKYHKRKGDDYPKKSRNAFIIFRQEQSSGIRAELVSSGVQNPSTNDISKALSARWHALDDISKSKYKQMAEDEKKQRQVLVSKYRTKHPRNEQRKRPLTEYNSFLSETIPTLKVKYPNAAYDVIFKLAARIWNGRADGIEYFDESDVGSDDDEQPINNG